MKARDVMTKYIKMCYESCSVKDATQIMNDLNCGAVPIVNNNSEVTGIVTDRDIALYTILHEKNPSITKVTEFMSRPVITANINDDINDVIAKMRENKIRRIPIVDDNHKLAGMVSLGDIAVHPEEEHEVFEALENISTPVSSAK